MIAKVLCLVATATANHLRLDPTLLKDLEHTTQILHKELDLLENLNKPITVSSQIEHLEETRFLAATSTDPTHPLHARFESSVDVPDSCPTDCKDNWKKLSEVYAKYFQCKPKCEEDVLRDKTQMSEAVDDKCMVDQKCWESIEEIVFTKPEGGGGGGGGGDSSGGPLGSSGGSTSLGPASGSVGKAVDTAKDTATDLANGDITASEVADKGMKEGEKMAHDAANQGKEAASNHAEEAANKAVDTAKDTATEKTEFISTKDVEDGGVSSVGYDYQNDGEYGEGYYLIANSDITTSEVADKGMKEGEKMAHDAANQDKEVASNHAEEATNKGVAKGAAAMSSSNKNGDDKNPSSSGGPLGSSGKTATPPPSSGSVAKVADKDTETDPKNDDTQNNTETADSAADSAADSTTGNAHLANVPCSEGKPIERDDWSETKRYEGGFIGLGDPKDDAIWLAKLPADGCPILDSYEFPKEELHKQCLEGVNAGTLIIFKSWEISVFQRSTFTLDCNYCYKILFCLVHSFLNVFFLKLYLY